MSTRPAPGQDSESDKLHKEIDHFLTGDLVTKQTPKNIKIYTGRRVASQSHYARVLAALALARSEAFSQIKISEELSSEKIRDEISKLASSVESTKQELVSHKEAIDKLCEGLDERPVIKETRLFDIDEKLAVIQPIPIVIEEFKDEVIASFPELEVYAVADSEPEAISNLKTEIRDLYYDLIETPKDELGKLPLSWLRILERLIRKLGDA